MNELEVDDEVNEAVETAVPEILYSDAPLNQVTVLSARLPRWNDPEHTSLNLLAVFDDGSATFGEVPFTASPDDSEAHGRELFQRAVAGEFGDVLEPTDAMLRALVEVKVGQASAFATARIGELQAELATLNDAVTYSLATAQQLAALPARQAAYDAWCIYRVRLSQIETQAGFPARIEWPEQPV